ncbi:hypothetical protein [Amycolatopsis suaedae]|uniref:Uncharacterized protein n=1 Tax=Amycolatopsis suaedae TaxID=2510978 RepID=A0A4Q7JBB2_9PSEU|nr:hypothetical protein [Amycolatopsis suaedae]RZQ64368.1 hypothetical protein EWH70_10395 [Amycolatopsis suaedae]
MGKRTSQLATATIGGRDTEFPTALRDGADNAADLRLTFTVPVSLREIEGALWFLVWRGGVALADLADPADARFLVVSALLDEASVDIAAAADELSQARRGTHRGEVADRLRHLAADVFGPTVPSPRRARTAGVGR